MPLIWRVLCLAFVAVLFLRHLFYSLGWVQIHYTAKDGLKLTAVIMDGSHEPPCPARQTHLQKEFPGPWGSREESQACNYLPGSPLLNRTFHIFEIHM